MSNIKGNISSVKKATLEYMDSFFGTVQEPGEFFPGDLVMMMTYVTLTCGREVAVFLDRKNRVVSISLGDSASAELPEEDKRRGSSRLSGLRVLHTHPSGSVSPSDIDINSLKSLRLDAMAVIGVRQPGEILPVRPVPGDLSLGSLITGLSAAVLTFDEEKCCYVKDLSENSTPQEGAPDPSWVLKGPFSFSKRKFFNDIFSEISTSEAKVRAGAFGTKPGEKERALAIGLITPDSSYDFGSYDETLAELCELIKTAGAEVAGIFTQRRQAPDPGYYIGKGLCDELSKARQSLNATLAVFDDELSASQINNLERETGLRVIDRTALVLDIFALRAASSEGRLQVELAQQKYRLPRLLGQGHSLSRLGGGIGTRGPGETKLESDRRHVRRRIEFLEAELRKVSQKRSVLRKERSKKDFPEVGIVGYTNAGKSTLQNALCGSDSLCEDKLFATLDPQVRRMISESGRTYLVTDTVGFIRKLPHELVEAFKSTLEETVLSDLLLVVADAADPQCEEQIETVLDILKDIGAGEKPRFLVLNKWDKVNTDVFLSPDLCSAFGKIIRVSAASGYGLSELKAQIEKYFTVTEKPLTYFIPYGEGALLSAIHDNGRIISEEYDGSGVRVRACLPYALENKLRKYIEKQS